MSGARVSMVDVYVLRGSGARLECLVLRRSPGGRCAGSWESVHGHVEEGERPVAAALREMREETGLEPTRFYNLSRVESFYLHGSGEVALIPAFAAFVAADATATTGAEHDAAEWLGVAAARTRLVWPRERRALDDVVVLLGEGGAGLLEDVLRIC